MKLFFGVIFLSLLTFHPAFLQAHSVQRSVSPVYSFPSSLSSSGLDEQTAKILMEIFRKEFDPDFAGRRWQFDFQWDQPYLGAGTSYYDNILRVMLWGGMIRAEFMNLGALSALMCHELGHLLAGPPLQILSVKASGSEAVEDWAAAEGTSDHYAATVCLPRVYKALRKNHPELLLKATAASQLENNPKQADLHQFIAEKCQSYPGPSPRLYANLVSTIDPKLDPSLAPNLNLNSQPKPDRGANVVSGNGQELCLWTVQSGIDLIEFLQVYFDRDVPFANPMIAATEQPEQTIQLQYPSYQCRMQIFVDGGSCADGKKCPFSRCWYATEKGLP